MPNDSSVASPITVDSIRQIYLFQALGTEQLEKIVNATDRIELSAGHRLFNQGEPITRFFYVEHGRMKLYRLSIDGAEKVVDLIGPGRTFAEAVVFMDAQSGYPVNADALESTSVLGFDAPTFLGLLRQSNESCLKLMGVMSQRLRWQVNEIDRLALQNATTRFIGFILNPGGDSVVDGKHIELTVPKNVLASRLSIQPETFSRILARLSSAGLIRTDKQGITLVNVEKLRDLLKSPH
jgi:CRP/FNR family transcriptional regulator, dissimilatory nitrate respiration regulator